MSSSTSLLFGEELMEWSKTKHVSKSPFFEVAPKLYFGGRECGRRIETLKALGITLIVNVGAGKCYFLDQFEYLKLSAQDNGTDSLKDYFHDDTTRQIHQVLEKHESVLVHCMGGFSRSPSIICAYLILFRKVSLEQAMELIQRVRPCANPRDIFRQELAELAESI